MSPERAGIARVLAANHHDPHSVLGAHPQDGGLIVRALRPDVASLRALLAGGSPLELEQIDPAGLYAGFLPDGRLPLDYRLEATFADGTTSVYADPYSFAPTLGELDLHLIGEGRHEELADVLGAHERELDGVPGTAFSVWAPAARSVSVVGDFNGWDGRVHQLRSLGATGVWELFCPGRRLGRALQARDPPRLGAADPEGRPARPRRRGATADGLGRLHEPPHLERRAPGSSSATPPTSTTAPSRSTRSTSARGGETRSKGTAASPTRSSPRSSPATCATSASRTSSSCR